jgi:hypothetical protein
MFIKEQYFLTHNRRVTTNIREHKLSHDICMNVLYLCVFRDALMNLSIIFNSLSSTNYIRQYVLYLCIFRYTLVNLSILFYVYWLILRPSIG